MDCGVYLTVRASQGLAQGPGEGAYSMSLTELQVPARVHTRVHLNVHTHTPYAPLSQDLELCPPLPVPAPSFKAILQTHLSHIWPSFLPFLLEMMLSSATEHSLGA